jgi:AcrR family transcriptional regulator
MSIRKTIPADTRLTDTKAQLKGAAQLLFARHGVEAITVQQIVSAAGQRNNAALHYHFGDKDELVRQLVVDGAEVLDRRRREMLRDLEVRGGPSIIREVLLVLVMPVVELNNDERFRGYVRFTSNLQASNRKLLRAALNNRWNAGYVACLEHLKRMLSFLPTPLVEQRLSIFSIYANAILSAREAALEARKSENDRLWNQVVTIENILDTLEATVTCEPSPATLARLREPGATGGRGLSQEDAEGAASGGYGLESSLSVPTRGRSG